MGRGSLGEGAADAPLPAPGEFQLYGLDRLDTPPCSQARRAAVLISGALRFQRSESFPFLCDSSPPPPAVQF